MLGVLAGAPVGLRVGVNAIPDRLLGLRLGACGMAAAVSIDTRIKVARMFLTIGMCMDGVIQAGVGKRA